MRTGASCRKPGANISWERSCGQPSERNVPRSPPRPLQGGCQIDLGMIKQEGSLDGKFLLSANDENLPVKSLALGYKQLLAVDRAFRTLKSSLLLRPMYLSKDDRNRSHCSLSTALAGRKKPWTGFNSGLKTSIKKLEADQFQD